MHRARRAFTLVELLIVIVILGILIAIVVPSFIGVRDQARNAQAKSSVMTAYHNAKAIWALDEAYPSEAQLISALASAEPGLTFSASTPTSQSPRDIWVDVDALPSSDQDITLCGESSSGRWFCLRADETGGLVSLTGDTAAPGPTTVLVGEDGPMVARANADEMAEATCLLPTRSRAAGQGCDYGTGGIGWEGNEDPPEGLGEVDEETIINAEENAPVNLLPPAISGQYAVGGSMTVSDGVWAATPDSITYQWEINHGAGWVALTGATANTYAPLVPDTGGMVRVKVTATNAWGSTDQLTESVGPVVDPVPPAPASLTAPVVSGTAKQGESLTTTDGTWSGSPNTFTYQWQRDTGSGYTDISGATSATYTAGADDYQAMLRVVVTARNAGGSTAAQSNAAGPVALAGIILNGDFEAPWTGNQPAVWTNESTSYDDYAGTLVRQHTGGTSGPNRLRLLSSGTAAVAAVRSNAFLSDGRNLFLDLGFSSATGAEYRLDLYDDGGSLLQAGTWTTVPTSATTVEVPMYAYSGQTVRLQINVRRPGYGALVGMWVDNVIVDPNPAEPYLTIDSGLADEAWTRSAFTSYAWTTYNTTGVSCTLNSAPVACSGSGATLTGLTPGDYTFTVTATNGVGSFPVTRTFQVAEAWEILNGDFESGWSGNVPAYWTDHSTTYLSYIGSILRSTSGGTIGPERLQLRSVGPNANGIIRSSTFVSDGRDVEVDLVRIGTTGGRYRIVLLDGSGSVVRAGSWTTAPGSLTTATFDMLPADDGETRMLQIEGSRTGYGAMSGVAIDGVRVVP